MVFLGADPKRAELLAVGRHVAAIAAELARLQAALARQAGIFSGIWVSALLLSTFVALLPLPLLPLLPNRPQAVVEPLGSQQQCYLRKPCSSVTTKTKWRNPSDS